MKLLDLINLERLKILEETGVLYCKLWGEGKRKEVYKKLYNYYEKIIKLGGGINE